MVKRLQSGVIAQTPPGRTRSAAIVGWFEGLYETEGQEGRFSLAVERYEVLESMDRLERFAEKLGKSEPSAAEIEQWAKEIPG